MNRRGFFGRALGGFVAAVVGPNIMPARWWATGDGCPGAWTANLVVSENMQVYSPLGIRGLLSLPLEELERHPERGRTFEVSRVSYPDLRRITSIDREKREITLDGSPSDAIAGDRVYIPLKES